MRFIDRLQAASRHSKLCVGLDPDPAKFPAEWAGDARRMADFCCAIVPVPPFASKVTVFCGP